jgi:hypothetical protein
MLLHSLSSIFLVKLPPWGGFRACCASSHVLGLIASLSLVCLRVSPESAGAVSRVPALPLPVPPPSLAAAVPPPDPPAALPYPHPPRPC